jgi:hypothetical protein
MSAPFPMSRGARLSIALLALLTTRCLCSTYGSLADAC